MNVRIIIFGILFLLALASCAPKKAQEIKEAVKEEAVEEAVKEEAVKEEAVKEKVEEPLPETLPKVEEPVIPAQEAITTPAPIAEAPKESLTYSSEVAELLKRSEKLTSVRYTLVEPGLLGGHTWLFRDTKIKIEIQRPLEIRDRENYFDTVYLDLEKKAALAVCTSQRDCLVPGKKFQVDFFDWYRLTPEDWLASIPPRAKITGEQQFENRDVVRLYWKDCESPEGKNYPACAFLVSKQYGVPIRIDFLGVDGETVEQWQYKDFQPNSVKLSDVAWPG